MPFWCAFCVSDTHIWSLNRRHFYLSWGNPLPGLRSFLFCLFFKQLKICHSLTAGFIFHTYSPNIRWNEFLANISSCNMHFFFPRSNLMISSNKLLFSKSFAIIQLSLWINGSVSIIYRKMQHLTDLNTLDHCHTNFQIPI